jgi:hypothetical protein
MSNVSKTRLSLGACITLAILAGCSTTSSDKRMASAVTPQTTSPSAETTAASPDGQAMTPVPVPAAVRSTLEQAQNAVGEAQLRGVPTDVPYEILSRAQATAAQGDFATAQKLAQDAILASQQSLVQESNNKAHQAMMRVQRHRRSMRTDQLSRLQAAQLWLDDGQGERAYDILNRLDAELTSRR